jgi:hypothetical protein
MTDLEPQLRERLAPAAASPRGMPPGTGRRVAARRVAKTTILAGGLAAFMLAVALVVPHGEQHAAPAGGGKSAGPAKNGASVGPTFTVPDGWPVVTLGGDVTPYIDHDGSLGIAGQKQVVAFGTANGIPWTITGFNTDGEGLYRTVGVCGDIEFGDGGTFGGAIVEGTPCGMNPYHTMVGETVDSDQLLGYASVLSKDVAKVEIRLKDGANVEVPILPGPAGIDANFFVFFTPGLTEGEAVSLDASGNVITTAKLCMGGTLVHHIPNSSLACGS